MDTLKTVVTSGIVALIVAAGLVAVMPHGTTAAAPSQQTFGGTNPDIPSQYLKWGAGNGVRTWPTAQALKTASTTPCAIISPLATSTISHAGIKLDVSSSTATTWTIARATTAYATTTQLGTNYTVAGGAQGFIQASTSPTAGAPAVFPPSTYLVFSETGGITAGDAVGTGFAPVGTCEATFTEFPTI